MNTCWEVEEEEEEEEEEGVRLEGRQEEVENGSCNRLVDREQ